ncbi:MAG TPA: FecR domain-containing protein [Sphingomonadaceae bacterium]|nr:FecR domain-containing protein [Sphingomonadaceae bacterium]
MPQAQAETLLFATTLGEVRQVPLPDGSRMTLDALSKAQVRMGPGERQVTLDEGRARFALARRADRPLVVEAGRTRVTADAGTFDVGFIDGNTTVRPLQGGVSVRNLTGDNTPEPVRLSAGEALDIPHSGLPSRRRYPAGSAAQWPAGRLEFADTRLDQVIAEASRYSRGSISLSTPSLAALRVTGTFRAGNLPALARSLAAAFNLRLEQTRAGHFVLQPPPTSSRVANPKK